MEDREQKELLQVRGLRISYTVDGKKVRAVNGVDLSISAGRTLGIVGETGAGKTTTVLSLLKLLPRYSARIDGGEILWNEKGKTIDLAKASNITMQEIRGDRIAMIFQDPMTSLNPVMTIGEQIAEVLYLHAKGDARNQLEQKVDEVLRLVGIAPERKHDYPHQFSGGMKQRVVIAIALVSSPALLIADEPTTALDVTIQAQVLALMKDLQQRLKTAMIFISHDLGIIVDLSDDVAIMYAGEFVEYGTVYDIFDPNKPHHPYTAGLFAAIPNLTEEVKRLRPIHGLMPDPTALPAGCKFHPRCEYCTERCAQEEPPYWERDGHRVKCWRILEKGGRCNG